MMTPVDAFKAQDEVRAISSNPENIYTVYIGMPRADVDANFKDISGWQVESKPFYFLISREYSKWASVKAGAQLKQSVTMPSFDVLVSIANYFNVTLDFLLGRTAFPFLDKDFVYFCPIGEIKYSIWICNEKREKEKLEGTLEYIFRLTVWNMELPKDETALNQFLCFKFSKNESNQRLYECLFLTDELNVREFLFEMQEKLGLPFMKEYAGPMAMESQYLANLLVWNEDAIKPPIGVLPYKEPQYLATLLKPIFNENVRLDYGATSGAMPHMTAWLGMSKEAQRDLLMRRLRRIKSNFREIII